MTALAVGVLACGGEGDDLGDAGLGTPDSGAGAEVGAPDTGPAADAGDTGGAGAGEFAWLAIVDNEPIPMCDMSTAPGPDIDSVDHIKAGSSTVTGVGLMGSASFVETFPGGASNIPCSTCGSAQAACMHSGAAVVARAEGIKDAMSYANMPDVGYIALNAGALWLQIGTATGGGPAQSIRSGDTIVVREVDRVYVAEGSAFPGCTCNAEKYIVYAYVTKGDATTRVQLEPSRYRPENAADCGETPTQGLGCGTTDFLVP